MNSVAPGCVFNDGEPEIIADMALRIERSLELRDRIFSAHCSPDFTSIVLQVAITAHRGHQATIKSLAAERGLSPSTVSRKVRRLVSRGLLISVEDAQDKRRTVVKLTAKSESLANQYFQNVHPIFYRGSRALFQFLATHFEGAIRSQPNSPS